MRFSGQFLKLYFLLPIIHPDTLKRILKGLLHFDYIMRETPLFIHYFHHCELTQNSFHFQFKKDKILIKK
jgi:hypothetical protein